MIYNGLRKEAMSMAYKEGQYWPWQEYGQSESPYGYHGGYYGAPKTRYWYDQKDGRYYFEIEMPGVDLPYVELRIVCSKGTYIRTICDDMGQALGVGAHMVSLVRTRIGSFRIEDSTGIEGPDSSEKAVCSIDSALSHLEEIILDEYLYRRAMNGIPIDKAYRSGNKTPDGVERGASENVQINQYVRIKSPDRILFGIGKLEQNRIIIERLLN